MVIYERDHTLSMGMSFFTSCPLTGGLPTCLCEACPGATAQELEPVSEIFSGLSVYNKSLHARSGPGAWLKKDISMLFSTFSFLREIN